ncbi:acetyl-CoA C-acetyltransferase [Kallotenue papyrolyticum]|uniref:acetyl-CoA C-acetyltransferase n=1 Tax=Kallotenue papyrolyticum TaxID=1325125 RepID=UPI0004AE7EDD|nr:acetyl-CoA C-acetyltransferase [Kallotenue papyrolyticum]
MAPLNDRDTVIVAGARTPIGKFGGALSGIPAPHLGGYAIRAALERAGIDPALVDEVIMGNVLQAGEGQAPARQAALKGGLPESVGALTINKVCGSGLKAVMLAAALIRAGDAEVIVAGGMENMSAAPYLLPQARFGYRLGNGEIIDSTVHDGLWCAVECQHMGMSAEWIAQEFGVSREQQDAFALRSHQRAAAAQDAGKFDREIVPIEISGKKGQVTRVTADEPVRRDTDARQLAGLRPAFKPDGGTVTAGNAPGITDGAAALVVMSAAKARELGVTPLARIMGYAQAALKPLALFAAPPHAIRRLLEQTGTTLDDYDLFEINEAFAAQIVANANELGLDQDRLNVHGGAIALGHPIGASGARVLVTLLHALQDRGGKRGIASLCLGGGEAVALAIELL